MFDLLSDTQNYKPKADKIPRGSHRLQLTSIKLFDEDEKKTSGLVATFVVTASLSKNLEGKSVEHWIRRNKPVTDGQLKATKRNACELLASLLHKDACELTSDDLNDTGVLLGREVQCEAKPYEKNPQMMIVNFSPAA